jgi:hypothetical protein
LRGYRVGKAPLFSNAGLPVTKFQILEPLERCNKSLAPNRSIIPCMWRHLLVTATLSLAVPLIGCATNDFTESFQPGNTLAKHVLRWSGRVHILESSDIRVSIEDLSRQGFLPLGSSSFSTGESVDLDQLRETATSVGADIVLYYNKHIGSRTASLPIRSYQPGRSLTTRHSGVAQVNPSPLFGGPKIGFVGESVTEESGTYSTTYVPITVDRYKHVAIFWRKARPAIFGARVVALPDDLRQSLGRNTGVLVRLVIDESPAFLANILSGDVIIGIDSVEITSSHDFDRKVDVFAGKQCNVVILRDGEEKIIPVRMNRR